MLKNASEYEISAFKEMYCKNEDARDRIARDFEVEVESFEELLPGKTINSYATGNRAIENAFIMFSVIDRRREIQYFPVFSETVGRNMIKKWGKPMPQKRSIFVEETTSVARHEDGKSKTKGINDTSNGKLRRLIIFARSLMTLHIENPQPMNGPLKSIYTKLEENPREKIRKTQIKAVNTCIGNFLKKNINTSNENFGNIQEYIFYLQSRTNMKRLKDVDFDLLRDIMKAEYPGEEIYF